MKRALVATGAILVVATVGTWMLGGGTNHTEPAEVNAAPSMVVHIDPATGKVIPPAEGATIIPISREMSEGLSRSEEGLVQEKGPTGGYVVDLQGRFQHTQVVTMDEDGNLRTDCIDHNPSDLVNHNH